MNTAQDVTRKISRDSNSQRTQVAIFSDEPGWHGRQLKREFAAVGLEAIYVSLSDCSLDLCDGHSSTAEMVVIPAIDPKKLKGAFVRGIPGGRLEEVILRLNVLHSLQMSGIPVMNSGRAIERTVDKGMTSFLLRRERLPTMATWVTESRERAQEIAAHGIKKVGSIVAKPLFGSQGNGVKRISSLSDFEAFTPCNGVYYLQTYVRPEGSTYRDWRVFVINGKAIAAMQRSSQHWVTNRAQGAVCEPIQPDNALKVLAEKAAQALRVDYAGVDLMRDTDGNWLISEVNGIPAWQGLQRACKVNVAKQLVNAFLSKANAPANVVASA